MINKLIDWYDLMRCNTLISCPLLSCFPLAQWHVLLLLPHKTTQILSPLNNTLRQMYETN